MIFRNADIVGYILYNSEHLWIRETFLLPINLKPFSICKNIDELCIDFF